jgi:hypothetical protein
MSAVRFLLDNHVTSDIRDAVHKAHPEVDIRAVGVDDDAPADKTSDPELLDYATDQGLTVVTFDANTMPRYAFDRIARGVVTCGVFVFPHGQTISSGSIAHELEVIWGASTSEEWLNRVEFAPL